ncbi:MAG: alkaline phosphatase family protein, partial [Clostridia bacterium]|nr:alkaline phosphatase family protein [Clostridia bacterium]
EAMKSGEYDFIRCNYPNGDMVGHTGSLDATITAVAAVDLGIARVLKVADELGITVLITADHGNADEMLEKNKKGELQVRTAHSLNPVPFIICSKNTYEIKDGSFGLANVAPTVAQIFGIEPYGSWLEGMIK